MIKRELESKLLELAKKFPVVSVTGPRQSGKTTLLKVSFPEYTYTSLEDPDTRIIASEDPRSFLVMSDKMIIDEIQRLPELFSYIQTITDQTGISGQFIISGSQSFLLNKDIAQSLAGRVAVLRLLPFSYIELRGADINFSSYETLIHKGFYPRIYDKEIDPADFFPSYIQTYIERDVRLLQNIRDLNLFVRFMKLCAGRTGQLLNMNSLANDTGVSVNTVKSWISVLEASFVIFLLSPHHKNFNKRLVKMPKLYFFDTGLACSLLGIETASQLKTHYLTGGLFENFVISELIKSRYHRGLRNNCYFWRDHKGNEVDCLIEKAQILIPVEIKSARTYTKKLFKGLIYWKKISGNEKKEKFLIYGGDNDRLLEDYRIISWKNINNLINMVNR
ncbi:MAG: ATP-binding protein [Bacteroidota bacterium]